MKIAWVLSDSCYLNPAVDLARVREIGPIWGSWKTWRSFQTDNAICYDQESAVKLLIRQFQTHCNFYLPNNLYQALERPPGVKLFDGDYGLETDNIEEIIAMHLAASQNDIVLLWGFDWTPKEKHSDRLLEHRAQNYRNLIKHAIRNNAQTQWVLIDHSDQLMLEIKDLENLTTDSMNNVLSMLST